MALDALRPFRRAGMVAVVLAVWWGVAPREAMPPVSPMGDQPIYTTADEDRLPLLEPVLHAPWTGGTVVAGVVLPIVVVSSGVGLAAVTGASALATLFVMLALVIDASFGAGLAHQSGLAVAAGLVWLAAGAAFSEPPHPGPRPWLRSLAVVGSWVLAVWWHWLALAAWPIVLAGLRRRTERHLPPLWVPGSILAGVLAFLAYFDWAARVAAHQAFAPNLSLSWRDALVVAFDSRPRMPLGSFAAPDVTVTLSALALSLAGVGLVFGMQRASWRRAVVLTAALIGAVGLGWPEWQAETLRFGLWLLAPVAALGLTWASRQAGPRGGWLVASVLGSILIADTAAMSVRPLSGLDARGFRDAFERALAGVESRGGTVIVAEDTRTDSALAAWMAGRADVWRAAQSGAVVSEALAAGRTVLAGPTARRHLLLAGVQFSDGFVIRDPQPLVMSVASEVLQCAAVRSDRWSLLPGVEYTGRLGIALPAGAGGEMRVIVGDNLPLAVRVETSDGRVVPVSADALLSGPGDAAPPPDYWIESGAPEDSPPIARLLHLSAHPVLETSWSVRLGRRAPRVLARLVGFGDATRGRVCAAPVGDRLWFSSPRPVEPVALDEHDVFGRGWYGLEGEGAKRFRWTDIDPVLLLRSAKRTDVTIELDAQPAERIRRGAHGEDGTPTATVTAEGTAHAADGARMAVTLRVNGIDVGTRWMTPGAGPYAWAVPAGVWLAGTNELWWHTSHGVRPADAGAVDTRLLAMRVSGVTLRDGGAPADAALAYGTETSSISKSRVALRGIVGGLPAAP